MKNALIDSSDSFSESEDEIDLSENISVETDLKEKKVQFEVAIDSEFEGKYNISLQACVRGVYRNKSIFFSFIVIDQNFKNKININKEKLKFKEKYKRYFKIFYDDLTKTDRMFLLKYIFIMSKKYGIVEKEIFLLTYFYFSLKDLNLAFGFDNLKEFYLKGKQGFKGFWKNKIVQKRNTTGTFDLLLPSLQNEVREVKYQITLKDLYGVQSSGGLQELMASNGLEQDADLKKLMDPFKTCMTKGLLSHPNDFVSYSMNDVYAIFEIVDTRIKTVNNIIEKTYGIKDGNQFFNINSIPYTVGRLVSSLFQKFFDNVFFRNDDVLQLSYRKHGILNPMFDQFQEASKAFEILQTFDSLENLKLEVLNKTENYKTMLILLKKGVFKFLPHQYCSIDYLLQNSSNNTRALLAISSGGSTINNRPQEYLIKYGADIDISGAYGNVLKSLSLTLGIPRIFAESFNDAEKVKPTMTLGEFMDKHYSKMVKNKLFKVIVTGDLFFEQDFIHSKVTSYDKIIKKTSQFEDLEIGQKVLETDFCLLRKEIKNGVINAKVWDVLNKVCTNNEFSEFRALRVVSAMYFYDEDFIDSLDNWLDHILKDKGRLSFDNKLGAEIDKRTFKYTLLPLSTFVNPLLEARKILKQKKDVLSIAQQTAYKLIINTLYGDITSIFFEVLNNMLISETITTNTRCNVWLITKAFNGVMTITDGTPYSLMDCSYLKPGFKKPGMNTLSSYYSMKNHKSLSFKPLDDVNWNELIENNYSPKQINETYNLNKMALDHLKTFWNSYNISIDFDVEHKENRNPFKKCAYTYKAHYALQEFNDKTNLYDNIDFVIRGTQKDNPNIKYPSPFYSLLRTMIDEKDAFELINDGYYQDNKILRLNAWRENLRITEGDKKLTTTWGDFEPGDSLVLWRKFYFNNKFIFVNTYKEYKQITSRSLRVKEIKSFPNGQKLNVKNDLFERYFSQGIKQTYFYMNRNELKRKSIKIKKKIN